MINYELRHDEGILVLHPEGPLEAADFISITKLIWRDTESCMVY